MAPCFIPFASNELYPWTLKILVLKEPARNPFPIAFCLSELVSLSLTLIYPVLYLLTNISYFPYHFKLLRVRDPNFILQSVMQHHALNHDSIYIWQMKDLSEMLITYHQLLVTK